MALNKVEICGVNTSSLPVLTSEEKEELFEKIKAGDKEARERYIKGNLRLVLSVIKRFGNSSENADDLFQIGCIGLMKAIDNFDTTLMVRFSTYAVPMIMGEIRRYLRDNSSIRVSRSLRDIAYKAIYAKENYIKKNLKEPTIAFGSYGAIHGASSAAPTSATSTMKLTKASRCLRKRRNTVCR